MQPKKQLNAAKDLKKGFEPFIKIMEENNCDMKTAASILGFVK